MRTALFNWLFAKRQGGAFILRLDDTDRQRGKPEYETAIERDLAWLGLDWARKKRQSERLVHYDAARDRLIAAGRLYPCYETPEELEFKRKRLLAQGRPPVYDRAALRLGDADRARLEGEGRRPHWRFKLTAEEVRWDDLVRGLPYAAVRERLPPMIGEKLWLAVRGNLATLADAGTWAEVVDGSLVPVLEDPIFLEEAAARLPPEPWDETTWKAWTTAVSGATQRKGRALYHPLRLALTARETGPEMAKLLPLIGRARAAARLSGMRA